MTTVIAVQCRDGVILCADGQETFSGYTKEDVSKIHPVGFDGKLDKYSMLGCAGASDYIALFRQYVGKVFLNREGMTYFDALDKAVCDYTNYISKRSRAIGNLTFENAEYPSALFAGYDRTNDKTQVFELNPPHPPHELSTPYRVTIGTGRLYSSQFFRLAEKFMYKIGLDWPRLGTGLVSQFCYMVLGRVIDYDVNSGMSALFYRVDSTGCTSLSDQMIFPGHGKEEDYRLSILLKTLLEELPEEKLLELARLYKADEILLKKLGSVSAGSPLER